METDSEHSPSSSMVAPANTTRARPSRRRWLQFSLRTLLIVTTLLAIGFGLIVASSRRQHEAEMLALTTLGATGYASRSADAHCPPLGSEERKAKTNDTPDRVNASVNLPDWLDDFPGLAADGIFGRVTRLEIGPRKQISRLTPAEKESVGVLHSLRSLYLQGYFLDRDDVASLASCPDLYHLALVGCTFDPGAFEAIGQLRRLEFLILDGSNVKNEDLSALAGLTRLRVLNLSHTEVTDQGLVLLEKHPSLSALELSGSRHTDEGVERLRQAIPRLQLLDD